MASLSKVHSVLVAMNEGDGTGLATRLQYLNHQGFPPGLRVGRSKRSDYDLDEVLAFALWFSLTQASFPPGTAMALVNDFWPELSRLFLAAARETGINEISIPNPTETIAVICGNVLKSTSRGGREDPFGPARPWNIVPTTERRLAGSLAEGLGASIVIDFASTWRALLSAIKSEPTPVSDSWVDEQIMSIAQREGWTNSPIERDAPPTKVRTKEVPARGEKLGEQDYYFCRAIELIDTIRDNQRMGALSPRLGRLADYLLAPSPREEWKRWVEVGDSGAHFVWSVAALLHEKTTFATHIPETVRMAAAASVAGSDSGALAMRLRETAVRARAYEPVPSN